MKTLSEFISESTPTRRYVDVVVRNSNNQILVLRRANYLKNFGGKWGVVGGSIEKDEASEEAAYRELYEETGIEKSQINSSQKFTTIKFDNDSTTEVWVVNLKDNYNNNSIKISKEHAQYKWISDLDEIKGKWMEDIKEVLEKITEL